jgi:hypothetical protein
MGSVVSTYDDAELSAAATHRTLVPMQQASRDANAVEPWRGRTFTSSAGASKLAIVAFAPPIPGFLIVDGSVESCLGIVDGSVESCLGIVDGSVDPGFLLSTAGFR